MKATLNRHLFTTTVFDSGSLGLLTSVIHQFEKVGRYRALVHHKGRPVGNTVFEVADDGPMQLDIDLSSTGAANSKSRCDCDDKSVSVPTVSPKGYVLFWVSRGVGGYSVIAGEDDKRADAVFNSEILATGDMFALSLLEPSLYTMWNRLGSAKGKITVSFDESSAKHLKELQSKTKYVEASIDVFDPDSVATVSTQGIVFRVRDRARIVIEKAESVGPRPGAQAPRRIQGSHKPESKRA